MEKEEGRAGGASHGWYSHEEGHQLNQGLLLGAGGKLGDGLDDFVHDAAQVALQLLPPLLYELGVLGRQTGASVKASSPTPLPTAHTGPWPPDSSRLSSDHTRKGRLSFTRVITINDRDDAHEIRWGRRSSELPQCVPRT